MGRVESTKRLIIITYPVSSKGSVEFQRKQKCVNTLEEVRRYPLIVEALGGTVAMIGGGKTWTHSTEGTEVFQS